MAQDQMSSQKVGRGKESGDSLLPSVTKVTGRYEIRSTDTFNSFYDNLLVSSNKQEGK